MSTLDEDQCPTQYSMQTYDSEQEMLDAGAEMTHWGAVRIICLFHSFLLCFERVGTYNLSFQLIKWHLSLAYTVWYVESYAG